MECVLDFELFWTSVLTPDIAGAQEGQAEELHVSNDRCLHTIPVDLSPC